MKSALPLLVCFAIIFSCKKEKQVTPEPEPEPVKTGNLTINVTTYDSLGIKEWNFSGVKVSLYETAFSATTGANGSLTFSNVPYGRQLPVLLKNGYDGPPTSVDLGSITLTVSLPCANYSAYRIVNIIGQAVNKDSITVGFTLSRFIPFGKSCKLAILYSDTISASPSNFLQVDTISVTEENIQKLNVARLPNIRAALALRPKDRTFCLNVVPVSYGIIYSNVLGKHVLMGDNIYPPLNLNFKKTW
ncbi:MAG TPA: hypothetical protein PL029_09105 [Bacteroidia bacterium]|nr:hypothetical protein [Bacteroidia bacterium]